MCKLFGCSNIDIGQQLIENVYLEIFSSGIGPQYVIPMGYTTSLCQFQSRLFIDKYVC